MKILVLGGTRFVGRAVVDAALARGHELTLFNRGLSAPGLYPDVEHVIGDRTADLGDTASRDWDLVLDTAGYDPAVVRRSVLAYAEKAARYAFVSTVSVYASQQTPQDESGDVLVLTDATPPDERYGARKAACERIVLDAYGDRALIPRPGMIVGPHDRTDRFAYWPRRLARGGRVLAPGDPSDPAQVIDVRDLAEFTVDGALAGRSGTYNVVGAPVPFGGLLAMCRRAVVAAGGASAAGAAAAELVWADSDRLLAAGVEPWMGVPMWIAAPGTAAVNEVIGDRAVEAGLHRRDLATTVADVYAWDVVRGGPAEEGLSPAEESRLLAAVA